jgi:D-amino peptidase
MLRRPFLPFPLFPTSPLPRPALCRHGGALLSLLIALLLTGTAPVPAAAQEPLRIFISVDMEGIGGIGTGAMASSTGKDYATGRRLMTDEVNTVVAAILERGPAEILVNDSHGDMQNLLHTELDPRVTYIQGAIKPNGMMEGLDDTFHGVIFLGYHARAGTAEGFLAHTGSGAVKGLWINGLEAGEGEMNALYAGAMGVPVLLAAGDQVFVDQFLGNVPGAEGVVTKTAITPQSAHLLHPQVVQERLAEGTRRALDRLAEGGAGGSVQPMPVREPVEVRLRFQDVTRPQILQAVPGVRQVDGYTVEFTSPSMGEAYRLIRFLYRFVSV